MPADRFLHPKASKSQRITLLTDLEYRVWTQYLLSADDFGVMHATAVKLQSDNLHLANRPPKMLTRCLDALVKVALVHPFDHQGQRFVFQADWQRWQKVEYPRATDNPQPSGEALALCDEATRALFAKWPGGQRKDRRRADDDPNDSGRASRIHPEGVPPTRAGAPAERLTAKASGFCSEVVLKEKGNVIAFDGQAAFMRLCREYPAIRVNDSQRVAVLFLEVLGTSHEWVGNFDLMMANLDTYKRSHEWAVKRMVPNMDKWLESGRWKRPMEPDVPEAPKATARWANWKPTVNGKVVNE